MTTILTTNIITIIVIIAIVIAVVIIFAIIMVTTGAQGSWMLHSSACSRATGSRLRARKRGGSCFGKQVSELEKIIGDNKQFYFFGWWN